MSTISSQLKIRDCFPYQMRDLTIAPEDVGGWVVYIKWVKGMCMNTPPAKLSAFFVLPRHQATRLFQIMLSASYLPGYRNRHHPELGLFPQCEEEVETRMPIMLCSAAPPVYILERPSPSPCTSSSPGMTASQLKCSLYLTAALSLLTPGIHLRRGRRFTSPTPPSLTPIA